MMIKRALRFTASLILDPVVTSSISLFARLQRSEYIRVGKWQFAGPTQFLKLIQEAEDTLRAEDSPLFARMRSPFFVIYSPKQLFSFPLWKCGGVSEDFTRWGAQGVVAAWIYLLYHFAAVDDQRWAFSDAKMSINASRQAKTKTRDWLTQHKFPPELSDAFQ